MSPHHRFGGPAPVVIENPRRLQLFKIRHSELSAANPSFLESTVTTLDSTLPTPSSTRANRSISTAGPTVFATTESTAAMGSCNYTEQQSLDVRDGLARRAQGGLFVDKGLNDDMYLRHEGRAI